MCVDISVGHIRRCRQLLKLINVVSFTSSHTKPGWILFRTRKILLEARDVVDTDLQVQYYGSCEEMEIYKWLSG
jgi:hypothetical protein